MIAIAATKVGLADANVPAQRTPAQESPSVPFETGFSQASAVDMGVLAAASTLPVLLLALPAGVGVNRLPPVRRNPSAGAPLACSTGYGVTVAGPT